jgi:hypothetical protein
MAKQKFSRAMGQAPSTGQYKRYKIGGPAQGYVNQRFLAEAYTGIKHAPLKTESHWHPGHNSGSYSPIQDEADRKQRLSATRKLAAEQIKKYGRGRRPKSSGQDDHILHGAATPGGHAGYGR